jgi:hypothetical protein
VSPDSLLCEVKPEIVNGSRATNRRRIRAQEGRPGISAGRTPQSTTNLPVKFMLVPPGVITGRDTEKRSREWREGNDLVEIVQMISNESS